MTRLKAITAVSEKMNFLSILLILSVTGCYRSNAGLSTILRPRIRPLPQGIWGIRRHDVSKRQVGSSAAAYIPNEFKRHWYCLCTRNRVEAGAVTMPLGFDTAHSGESVRIYWPTSPGLSSAALRAV